MKDIMPHPYTFGLEDASYSGPCVPEMYYATPADCALYAAGYVSHNPTVEALTVLAHYGGLERAMQEQIERNAKLLIDA